MDNYNKPYCIITTHLITSSQHTSLHHHNTPHCIIIHHNTPHCIIIHNNTPHCIVATHLVASSLQHLIASSLQHLIAQHTLLYYCITPHCIIATHLIVLLKHTPPSLLTATLHRVSSSITYVLRVFFFVINAGLPLIHYRNLPPNNC